MTKSACAAASVSVWSDALKRVYSECDTWREAALKRIESIKPDLVVISDSRSYVLVVDGVKVRLGDNEAAWDAGLATTIRRASAAAASVALIGDTPRAPTDPPVCLSAHPASQLACATTFAQAIDPVHTAAEAAVAAAGHVTFVDPAPLVCPSDPCPVVLGRILVYRDTHHITETFSRTLAPYLAAVLPLPAGP
jgi:hypothetical protein